MAREYASSFNDATVRAKATATKQANAIKRAALRSEEKTAKALEKVAQLNAAKALRDLNRKQVNFRVPIDLWEAYQNAGEDRVAIVIAAFRKAFIG
jgi:uncharacterized protein (DUF4415 family)